MSTLPWITTQHPQFQSLISTANGTKMLIDPQHKNADAMASLWTAHQLCLSKDKPCGRCKSCHLLTLQTHPDSIYHAEACNIEQIRQIIQQIHNTPSIAPVRAVYLGRIDQYNAHALNALLKTLEEPPLHSVFLLSATSRRAVKPTVLSRTQTFSLPKPTHRQSVKWLIDEHQLTQEEAQKRLQTHADNPFSAITNKELPALEASIEDLIQFLASPMKHPQYLMHLEQLPTQSVIDYVQAQIGLIIRYLQFPETAETIDTRVLQTTLNTLNVVNLHTLYAKLATLRRPDKQQINPLLSTKSLLLQSMKQRSLST